MGQLYCGAAKRCITPDKDMLKDLVGLKQHRFAGVLDDIYVRVMAIGTKERMALVISFDLTTAPCSEEFLAKLSAQAGVRREDILFFSIHTHAVPFNDLDLEERERQSEETLAACRAYTSFLHEQVLAAAVEASAKAVPARMGYVRDESHVNVVRLQDYRVREKDSESASSEFRAKARGGKDPARTVIGLGADPSAYADPTLFVLRVESLGGDPIAFLVNYAMHNVATIWNDYDGNGAMGISGDIGGGVSRLLEEHYEGAVALWSSAAAGDLNPLMLNEVILPDPETGAPREYHPEGTSYARWCLRIMTARHGADVLRAAERIECGQREAGSGSDFSLRSGEEAGSRSKSVRSGEGNSESCAGVGNDLLKDPAGRDVYDVHMDGTVESVIEWSVTPGCECIRHHDAPPEFVTGDGVPDHTVRLHMLRIGRVVLLGVGAELYSSIGRAMLEAAPEDAVLISHNASTLCHSHYILDDATMERCRRSGKYAMIPGYDEYRCCEGVMRQDLTGHVAHMTEQLQWE